MIERKVICRREDVFGGHLSFFVRQRHEGTVYLGEPLVMKQVDQDNVYVPSPTFILRPEEAQSLMDSMWDAGLRPTEGSGSAGAMAATQRHLEDMRTLVFAPKA